MEAKELRSGNLLQGKPIQNVNQGVYSDGVITITAYGIYEIDGGRLTELKPIPLTEEWLLKFGFEKTFYEGEFGRYWDYIEHKHEFHLHGMGFKSEDMDFTFLMRKINFVHQLQNLYFALTGNELTWKP
jgi:hypothetical protein